VDAYLISSRQAFDTCDSNPNPCNCWSNVFKHFSNQPSLVVVDGNVSTRKKLKNHRSKRQKNNIIFSARKHWLIGDCERTLERLVPGK